MKIQGVILDLDGTLVDSNDAHANAWVDALQQYEYEVGFDEIRPYIGMGGDQLLPAAVGLEEESDLGQRISDTRSHIYKSGYFPAVVPFKNVRALVLKLRDDGYKVIAASSGKIEEVKANLELAGVDDLVTEYVSSDDADESKPAPDILQAAIDQLGLQAEEVVMIGDSPYDVQAAMKLNLPIVSLRCGGFSDQELKGSLAIYDDPADLLNQYESSVFGR